MKKRRCLVVLSLALTLSCSSPEWVVRRNLAPITLPDLSRTDPAVQAQVREQHASLMQRLESRAPAPDLASAYGRLGMLFQAAEYYDAAEPCYLNALTLAPAEMRWHYHLAHLYRDKGQVQNAEAAFKRVLELRPDDVATLVWLGRLHLDQGQPDQAQPLFEKALSLSPRLVAALEGLGRAALERRDYATAAKHFEEALAIDPEADSLHAPLVTAYRGLGQLEKAGPHLREWRNREIFVPDPLRQELDLILESGLSYELRGVRALEAQEWPAAAAFFRKGLDLAKVNSGLRRSLQHKLGTALFMMGDARGALEQFEEVVRQAPASGIDESSAKAHYSIGVLMASSGRGREAIDHLSAAVTYQPNYVEAHVALADALRRTGRVKASLSHYEEAVKINPRATQARLGYAFALVRLRRYREARNWLSEAAQLDPDQPDVAHALARLLAAAPDAAVRDGERAAAIVKELLKGEKTTELGETLAMTLAELGEFDQAAAIQRGVIDAAGRAGLHAAVRRMKANLQLYERQQPCRTPWADDDPVHSPGPPVTPDLVGASQPAPRVQLR